LITFSELTSPGRHDQNPRFSKSLSHLKNSLFSHNTCYFPFVDC
jgi:hypothetical protein